MKKEPCEFCMKFAFWMTVLFFPLVLLWVFASELTSQIGRAFHFAWLSSRCEWLAFKVAWHRGAFDHDDD